MNYGYDSGARFTGVVYPEATVTIGYGDNTDRPSTMSWTGSAGTQTDSYTYDGQLVTVVSQSGLANGQYTYTYSNDQVPATEKLQSGSNQVNLSLSYDADSQLSRVVSGTETITMTNRGPAGQVSGITDGNLVKAISYDSLGQVAGRTDTVNGSAVYGAAFTYNKAGQISQKVETIGGTTHTYSYTYDQDGQLTQVKDGSSVVESYVYDPDGNRTSVQSSALNNGTTMLATFNSQDQIGAQGSTNYTFDSDGFLSACGGDSFTYSARGELLSADIGGTTVTYGYDGIGRRVSRTVSGQTYQYLYGNPYDPYQITAIRDPANLLTTFYYDASGLLYALNQNGTWYYVSTDQVGTPHVVTDAGGAAVKSISTDSYGNVVATGGTTPTFDLQIGFAGGLADSLTGLVRFGLRDYDPQTGRWTAKDLQMLTGGDTNLYRYVLNDPVNAVDPTGLKTAVVIVNFYYGGPISPDHASITVDGHTYGFYPDTSAARSDVLNAKDVPGQFYPENNPPSAAFAIPVTPQQLQNMKKTLDQKKQQKLTYNLFRYNCQDNVRVALKSGGVNLPDFTPAPWELQYWMISMAQMGQAVQVR